MLGLSLAFQAQSPTLAHPRNERIRAAGVSLRARALTGAASMRRLAIVKRESGGNFS